MKSVLFMCLVSLSGCATICGGSKYNANVIVKDYPKARISYQGLPYGFGTATIKVPRKQANKFVFSVKVEGCKDQEFAYKARTFRGWAFAGTIVTWTGFVSGLYVPWGAALDLADGAVWKPNVREEGVIKVDYKNFVYPVTYTGCPTDESK